MNAFTIQPDSTIAEFVKEILVFEDLAATGDSTLPFFADGYPGLLFNETQGGLTVSPQNKLMPSLFLYGQTLHPVELHIRGAYKLVVFQLYPFVIESFFNIDPKTLNDGCFDLSTIPDGATTETELQMNSQLEFCIARITAFLLSIFELKKKKLDLPVRTAIAIILDANGQMTNGELCGALHITERTLERRFTKAVGLSPKQFSQVIRFQQSLEQLTSGDYETLSDIVYANGFSTNPILSGFSRLTLVRRRRLSGKHPIYFVGFILFSRVARILILPCRIR
ncbi:DUF6597 domain-containing transcriptional factor [Flavobacterium sp. 3HN19-14]|uniref:DUF6597 domain-containing transcriptional factor n=1 Tax=Flavobacterium sp. 3HN19-14 TaxID=3448133 RepID=UPI003EE324C3